MGVEPEGWQCLTNLIRKTVDLAIETLKTRGRAQEHALLILES